MSGRMSPDTNAGDKCLCFGKVEVFPESGYKNQIMESAELIIILKSCTVHSTMEYYIAYHMHCYSINLRHHKSGHFYGTVHGLAGQTIAII